MTPSQIRQGARFSICGTIKQVLESGNLNVLLDGALSTDIMSPKCMGQAELLSPASFPKLTQEQSALIRERLEAGDLADTLDSLTE